MVCVIHTAVHLHIAHIRNCLTNLRQIGWLVASLELRDRTIGPSFIHVILSWPGMLTEDCLKIKRNRAELQQSVCSGHLGLV